MKKIDTVVGFIAGFAAFVAACMSDSDISGWEYPLIIAMAGGIYFLMSRRETP